MTTPVPPHIGDEDELVTADHADDDVGDFMLRDNIVTRMFELGLDFMRQ